MPHDVKSLRGGVRPDKIDGVFAAVLDTCTLWPSLQRDVLLSFAVEGIYRPLWSGAILAELEATECSKLVKRGAPVDDAKRKAAALIAAMRTAFDDACVTGWEPLDGTFGLPDPDDEHVLAAAVVGGAGAIVTENLKDLRVAATPPSIHVLTPAEFASDTVAVDPTRALQAVTAVSARVTRPQMEVDTILVELERRYGWYDAVDLLRDV